MTAEEGAAIINFNLTNDKCNTEIYIRAWFFKQFDTISLLQT